MRRAVKNGDLAGLSAERLEELSVELEKPLGTDEYTCLHWACHYGKAEVINSNGASELNLTPLLTSSDSSAPSRIGCKCYQPNQTRLDCSSHLLHQRLFYMLAGVATYNS